MIGGTNAVTSEPENVEIVISFVPAEPSVQNSGSSDMEENQDKISTRPLLRQIEAMQETTARRSEAWPVVEISPNSRLQEAEAKAAATEERERSVNERLSQTLSRINVIEAQVSCLRAEQTQLSKSLEKDWQRAGENRQEYLVAKGEADTQEGCANQLEEEIMELKRKHKQELQEALTQREML